MAKKLKGVTSSSERLFMNARKQINAQSNIHTGFLYYKNEAAFSDVKKTLPYFISHPAYRGFIEPYTIVRNIKELGKLRRSSFSEIEIELFWTTQILIRHKQQLLLFLEQKAACERAFAQGNYEILPRLFTTIEEDHGASLWLLENRIAFAELSEGKEARSSYVGKILEACEERSFLAYLILYWSFRAEQGITERDFTESINSYCPPTDRFGVFTHLMLGLCPRMDFDSAASLLNRTTTFPVVDRYLVTVTAVQCLLASVAEEARPDEVSRVVTMLKQTLPSLAENVPDPALTRLNLAIGGDGQLSMSPELLTCLDHYSCGEYKNAYIQSISLAREVGSLDALNLAARAMSQDANIDTEPQLASGFMQRTLEILRDISSFSGSAVESVNELRKLALTNPNSPWSASARLIIARQENDERLFTPTRMQIRDALCCQDENPILSFIFLHVVKSQRYLDAIAEGVANSITLRVIAAMVQSGQTELQIDDSVSAARNVKLQVINDLRNGNPEAAIRRLKNVRSARVSPLVEYESSLLLAEALLRCIRYHECADLCAETFVTSGSTARLLPLERLLSGLLGQYDSSSEIDPCILGRISVVLLFDVYSRHLSTRFDAQKSDAFNDFLECLGLTRVSEINPNKLSSSREVLVYFLRYVCISEVLDQSMYLDSTKAVEDERALIIVMINDLNTVLGQSPAAELAEELREIRTRQVVRDTTLQLDQSKIFVNVDGIKKSINPTVREQWSRYRLLSSQQGAPDIGDFKEILISLVGERLVAMPIGLPHTERNTLFGRMVKDIRDKFTTSREFGLDSNLSTNLRHGDVARELRSPFSRYRIITNKKTDASAYQENDHWRFTDFSGREVFIQIALAEFSREIDDEIERLNRQIIRIKSDSAPNGLFDYTISDAEIAIIQAMVDKTESHDGFIDTVFQRLWGHTSNALSRIQKELHQVTTRNFHLALDKLQTSIANINYYDDLSGLITATNLVRPEMQAGIEKVSGWFQISRSYEFQDYAISIAFEAALATVKTYFYNMSIKFELEGPEQTVLCGWTLPYMVRLLALISHNCAQHFGEERGSLDIKGDFQVADGIIDLTVTNTLSASKNLVDLVDEIDSINAEFGAEVLSERVMEEGGSGYAKIRKILAHDLSRRFQIHVSLNEEKSFCVSILMNTKDIVR